MARAPRWSFPKVHTLYLSNEQDARLRRLATKSGRTVSEIMRDALEAYLDRAPKRFRKPDAEPTRADTRHAIAESARARRLARPVRNASTLPNQQVADRTPIWSAPADWQEPGDAAPGPCPLARDHDGQSFEPPANAAAWLVLHQKRARDQPVPLVWRDSSRHVLVALDTTQAQLTRLMGRRIGWLVLHPVDREGRLLRAKQALATFG